MNYLYNDNVAFSELKGKVLKSIENSDDSLIFTTESNEKYEMGHVQNCCETVNIEEIHGDLNDLLNTPILLAEEESSTEPSLEEQLKRKQEKEKDEFYYTPDNETWTFYKLATIKGSVTIRWYGTSNGYYSESVDFMKVVNYE